MQMKLLGIDDYADSISDTEQMQLFHLGDV
jgi:hypothetical protein